MVSSESLDITDLSREELLNIVGIFLGDLVVHYGMWFTETVHYRGAETAAELENQVLRQYFPVVMKRLAPYFGIEMDGQIPRVLAEKSREDLLLLIGDIAKTWVAGDGLWFQAVESSFGMDAAKQVNDTCLSHFAQMEALKIRQYLGLDNQGGLEALEKALRLRVYTSINAHSASWDDDGTLIFKMTECRVQSSRRRKDLEDYPCKSAGITEFSRFAQGIDPRIEAECVWCPPDRTPDETFCAWRFRMVR